MPEKAVTTFQKWATATVFAVYFLIFIGGLVRVSGAGLGCPDWPRCYGLWIPPTSADQLPSQYDPLTFNPILTWIEYLNRLVGVVVGFFILILAGLAVKNFSKRVRILVPSLAALVLVAFQGWLGKIVVSSDLHPFIVTLHLVMALVIVSILINVAIQARELRNPEPDTLNKSNQSRIVFGLWIAVMLQIVLGTQVRETLEWLSREYPLLNEFDWLEQARSIGIAHSVYGTLLTIAIVWIGRKQLKENHFSPLLSDVVKFSMAIAVAQLGVGVLLVKLGIPQAVQVFHQWMSSLLVGFIVAWFIGLKLAEKRAMRLQKQTASQPSSLELTN
ncbi:MAG: COX15/CtaA family protein [Chloroherpetonaceae bacterium]